MTRFVFVLAAFLAFGAACGKKKDKEVAALPVATATPTAVPNPTDATSNIVRTRAALVEGLPHLDSTAVSLAGTETDSGWRSGFALTGMADIWTVAGMVPDPTLEQNGSTPKITLKKYMGYALDDTLAGGISPITMFDNTMFIFCLMNQYLTVLDSTGLPADGSYDISMATADTKVTTNCKGNKDTPSTRPMPVTVTVTTVTGSTVYSKKYSMIDSTRPDKPLTLYVKTGADGTFNFGGDEIQVEGGSANRAMVMVDPVSKTIRYEYSGVYTDSNVLSANMSRLLVNTELHTGYIVSSETNPYKFQFAAGGETNGTNRGIATSLTFSTWTGSTGGSMVTYTDLNACLSDSTGEINTDNVLTCGGSVTVKPVSAAAEATAAIITSHPNLTDFAMKTTTVLPFTTPDEMYTAVWQP